MASIIEHLDGIENNVMSELKDFQKATVERIDELYRKGQKRVLVSDEVGLGKTLVARGTIAKFANLRYEEGDDLVKVVYICSNASIAEQNIEKLRIVQNVSVENTNTSRLSMQHLNIFMQENDENILNNYIQLIPLTPQTSFINHSQGTMDERALIFAILKRVPRLKRYLCEVEKIFRNKVCNWEGSRVYWEEKVNECNIKSDNQYLKYMIGELQNYSKEITDLINVCKKIKRNEEVRTRPIIISFRLIFADISLNKLDPDLIIMDEFQRFRYLLNTEDDSEMGKLISKFFDMDDLRILMLSATPYKMYSTLDEIYEDEVDSHYSEFFEVMNFLIKKEENQDKFQRIWSNYSMELKEFNNNDFSFIEAKNAAEKALYNTICRTERITENQIEDFIDDSDASALTILKEDVQSFKDAQELLIDSGLNINVPVDYIKSTPYIMSFMKHYQLKNNIESYFTRHPCEVSKMQKDTFWLNKKAIDNYEKIPYNNSRLKNLMDHVLDGNAEKLLWVPPSMPYYELDGVFKHTNNFSKTLIFSSWEMVPRMISSMVSYEVERKTIGELKKNNTKIHYFMKNRYPSGRIRFNIKNDRPTQMSLFSLFYPSLFLIDVYNPIDCLNRKLSLNEIENEVKQKIQKSLDKIPSTKSKREDSRWYYLAPLLLDSLENRELVSLWFENIGQLIYLDYFDEKGFITYFNTLKQEYLFSVDGLGKKPEDLVNVLCDMAIASPSICAYRLFEREFDYDNSLRSLYNIYSMKIARTLARFMNLPESIAVIDLIYESDFEDAYWKNVLKYSKDGNLQAVFDEYVHLLASGLYGTNEEKIQILTNKLLDSFNLRTTSYEFDTYDDFKSRINGNSSSEKAIRTHFAVAFTKGKSDDKDTNRKKSIREVFNSPFRPFVLASTSIGQEGLDFHNYCRRIVHWNLPSNPIDLEQREGRINRFKCLAIRQNLAKRYGQFKFKTNNVWDELFTKAIKNEKNDECSDLVPYWGLNDSEDMIKIERIVPMYPFSRDILRYDRLIKILSLYRLTLGQSRQEYLLDSIFSNYDVDKINFKELFINLSPYYKSDVKDFNQRYSPVNLDFLKIYSNDVLDVEINEKIFNDSQRYNLPINNKYCLLTTNDDSKLKTFFNADDIDLLKYWSKLIDKINDLNLFEELVKGNSSSYFILLSGIFMQMLRFELEVHNGFLSVMLYRSNTEYKDSLFEYLFNQKNKLEEDLGFELYWQERKKGTSWKILIFLPIDLTYEENWEDAINWHLFIAKRFKEVFDPKIYEYYGENPIVYGNDLRTQYWLKLSEKQLESNFRRVMLPHSSQWYLLIMDNLPYHEGRIELHLYPHMNKVNVSLVLEKSRQDLFEYLLRNKTQIENECGFNLDWAKQKTRRHIRVINSFDVINWDDSIEWQLETAEKFRKVFGPKIANFFKGFVNKSII